MLLICRSIEKKWVFMRIKQRILGMIPVWAQRLMPLRHRQGWTELMEDMASDKLSRNGNVLFETHLIFVAGLPKSGTTWLEQLLDNTPGIVLLSFSWFWILYSVCEKACRMGIISNRLRLIELRNANASRHRRIAAAKQT